MGIRDVERPRSWQKNQLWTYELGMGLIVPKPHQGGGGRRRKQWKRSNFDVYYSNEEWTKIIQNFTNSLFYDKNVRIYWYTWWKLNTYDFLCSEINIIFNLCLQNGEMCHFI